MRALLPKIVPRGQDALPWAVSVLAAVLLLALWLEAGVRLREQESQTLRSARSQASACAPLPLEPLPLEPLPLKSTVLRERTDIAASLEHSRRMQILRAILGSVLILGAALAIIAVLARKQRLYRQLENAQLQKQVLIEQLQQERNRAFQLASLDYLTGIPNRMEFVARAERELARARRSRNMVALYFLDLDRFKPVNDTLGHKVGDKLLKAVAERLRGSVREYDLVGRFGGDEFVVLVSELQDESQVAAIADKLLEAICSPFCDIEGHHIEIGTSVGVALAPRDGRDIQSLLAAADCAMYAAKSAGRGHFRFYDPALNNSTARDYELLARLKRAIADGELQLHYQSRVRLSDFSVAGLEALVRWQHPEHGLIYPGEFIPLAEAHDLIVPLGEWVIRQACHQLRAWLDQGIAAVPVAINISARQLNGIGLADCVRQTLREHDLPPQMLEIEVTESCFFDPDGPGLRELRQLEQLGMKISLDDYGTGFSSLNQLKRLPVNAIKIDRSFIKDIRNDANDMMIVSSTIILAHNLGLSVVAEGVETSEQLVHLKTAGCDEVQGFYFHRPVPAHEVPAILARSPKMQALA